VKSGIDIDVNYSSVKFVAEKCLGNMKSESDSTIRESDITGR
jgi:hypothetical protein